MNAAQVGALKHIELSETGSADEAVWTLVEESGRKTSLKVGPQMLALILQLACGLAERSSAAPRKVPPGTQGGMSTGMPASGIEVSPGRNPKEVALHVHLGKVDVAYLVPLDSVVIALGTLVQGLYTDPDGKPH